MIPTPELLISPCVLFLRSSLSLESVVTLYYSSLLKITSAKHVTTETGPALLQYQRRNGCLYYRHN